MSQTTSSTVERRSPEHPPSVNFAFSLGSYDSAAVATLPAQLTWLSTFRDLANPRIALVYRFSVEHEDDDIAAHFRMLCLSLGARALPRRESAALSDLAAITFVRGWGLTHLPDEPPVPPKKYAHRLEIQPAPQGQSQWPVKSDWSPMVDFARFQGIPVTIDLACIPHPLPAQGAPGNGIVAPDRTLSLPGDVDEVAAASFFHSISDHAEQSAYGLTILLNVYSNARLPKVFLDAIGRIAVGRPIVARQLSSEHYRVDSSAAALVRSPEEVLRVFHPPYGHIQGRGLASQRPTRLPLRVAPPKTGKLTLGYAVKQNIRDDAPTPVRLTDADRLRHLYVLGKTGSGKTNFLKTLIKQDLHSDDGMIVIDPHGDAVDYALRHCEERIDDLLYLDFSDPVYLPCLNPLLVDVHDASSQELAIEQLVDVVVRRSFNQWTGPVFEDTVRLLFSSLFAPPVRDLAHPTIASAIALLRQPKAREWIARLLKDSDADLSARWETFNEMLNSTIAENVRWVLSKFADFTQEGVLRLSTGAASGELSIREAFRAKKVILVKIPESAIGYSAANFLGSFMFARLHSAAMSMGSSEGRGFRIYVDEFQKYVTSGVEQLVAEGRKFNISLALAHQNLRQLDAFSRFEGDTSTRLREAILSNVGTVVCFRTSGGDVAAMADELGVPTSAVRGIGQYEALARCVLNGIEAPTFSLHVADAEKTRGSDALRKEVRRRMVSSGMWRRRSSLMTDVSTSLSQMKAAWSAGGSGSQRWRPS